MSEQDTTTWGEDALVSVVIPAYQCESTLGGAITSALTQTHPNIEVVVCIDGATDRSQQVAEAYGDRVRVVVQPNQGPSAARNTAIEHARGELVALLDADDILLPNFVERCLAELAGAGTDRAFVSCNALKMSRHGLVGPVFDRPADLSRQRMLMLEGNIASGHALFPKAMWQQVGGFDPGLPALEDWYFWTSAVLHGWDLHVINEPMAIYRLTPGSLSSQVDLMEDSYTHLRRHTMQTLGHLLDDEERAYLAMTIENPSAGHAKNRAAEALAAGDVAQAARWATLASRVAPSDRSLRLKAELLTRVPLTARLYAARESSRHRRLER